MFWRSSGEAEGRTVGLQTRVCLQEVLSGWSGLAQAIVGVAVAQRVAAPSAWPCPSRRLRSRLCTRTRSAVARRPLACSGEGGASPRPLVLTVRAAWRTMVAIRGELAGEGGYYVRGHGQPSGGRRGAARDASAHGPTAAAMCDVLENDWMRNAAGIGNLHPRAWREPRCSTTKAPVAIVESKGERSVGPMKVKQRVLNQRSSERITGNNLGPAFDSIASIEDKAARMGDDECEPKGAAAQMVALTMIDKGAAWTAS